MRGAFLLLAFTTSCSSTSGDDSEESGGAGGSDDSAVSGGGGSGGGSQGDGGGTADGSGGDASTGAGGSAFPECIREQWDCPSVKGCESYEPVVPAECSCDPARPKTPKDCAETEAFVCLYGYLPDDDGAVTEAPYQCECVETEPDAICSTHCSEHESGWDLQDDCRFSEATEGTMTECECKLTLDR